MTERRVFLDCEFIPERTDNAGLLTIGMTDNNGNSCYLTNRQADWAHAHTIPFMRLAVLPKIFCASTGQGAADVENWPDHEASTILEMRSVVADYFLLGGAPKTTYAWCGASDLFRLQGLWNHNWTMMPRQIPHWFQDLEGLLQIYGISESDLPVQGQGKHHALADAHHDKAVYDYIERVRTK